MKANNTYTYAINKQQFTDLYFNVGICISNDIKFVCEAKRDHFYTCLKIL